MPFADNRRHRERIAVNGRPVLLPIPGNLSRARVISVVDHSLDGEIVREMVHEGDPTETCGLCHDCQAVCGHDGRFYCLVNLSRQAATLTLFS